MNKGRELFYEDIFIKLQEKKVKYLLIGGVAVNLYGVQRATGDIDLILSMDQDNLSGFIAMTRELGLVPRLPVKAENLMDAQKLKEWRETKNMKVFSFIHPDNPYIMIDVMTEEHIIFEEAYKKRKVMHAFGIDISTASVDDLIKLKKISGRDQDFADIRALEKIRKL